MSKHQRGANIFWFVLIVGPFAGGVILALSAQGLRFIEPGFMARIFSLRDFFQGVGIFLTGSLVPCFIAAIICYFWVRRTATFSYLAAALIGFVAPLILFEIMPLVIVLLEGKGVDLHSFNWPLFKLSTWAGVSSALATRWLMGRFRGLV